MAQHAAFLLQSSFDVSFSCLLQDVDVSRKMDPLNATRIDNFVGAKRKKIHDWLLSNLNNSLRLQGLPLVDAIPWKCFTARKIKGCMILLKGWPQGIQVKKLMTRKECEAVLNLIQLKEIEIELFPLKNNECTKMATIL